MGESYSMNGNTESLRQRVFALLDENPYLTAKTICKLLDLPYKQSYRYLNKLKSDWKSNRENEQGSKCSSVHGWRGWCCVPYGVRRDLAVGVGWVLTKARNRWLLWRDEIGRMQWFETGKINLYIRKPVNLGRVKQLVCNGFYKTGLIEDIVILDQVLATIHQKEAHHVFETGQPLPRMTIDAFDKSHGITIKVGDKSHRRAVEVISRCPNWAERNERILREIRDLLRNSFYEKDYLKRPEYIT
jgi:hypothetical protein